MPERKIPNIETTRYILNKRYRNMERLVIQNPSVVGRYISPDYFCDREKESPERALLGLSHPQPSSRSTTCLLPVPYNPPSRACRRTTSSRKRTTAIEYMITSSPHGWQRITKNNCSANYEPSYYIARSYFAGGFV